MPTNYYEKFHPTDWLADTRILPIEARGGWIDLLCLMWRSTERGVLCQPNGTPYSMEEIAKVLAEPITTAERVIATLIDKGVASVDDKGRLYSRRILRERGVSSARASAGKKGAYMRTKNRSKANDKKDAQANDYYTSTIPSPIPKDGGAGEGDPAAPAEDPVPYGAIVDELNRQAGTAFRASSETTRRRIRARWAEGYREEDFRVVIADRCRAWKPDAAMRAYLRPETLFGPKFEGYLQAAQGTGAGRARGGPGAGGRRFSVVGREAGGPAEALRDGDAPDLPPDPGDAPGFRAGEGLEG